MTNIDKLPYLADYVGNEALDESLADIYAGQVNFERMLAVEPDLIIAPAWPVFTEPATLERLRTIAPTLIFDMQDADNDWRVGVQQVADALGKSEQGGELITSAVDEFTGVAESNPGLAKRPYSFGLYYKEQISLGSGGKHTAPLRNEAGGGPIRGGIDGNSGDVFGWRPRVTSTVKPYF